MVTNAGLCRRRALALAHIVRHDGEADPKGKRFDGRDDASSVCSPRRIDSPRRAKFFVERLSVFTAIRSRSWLDQMGCRTSKSRAWLARCGAFRADRASR